MAKSYLVVRIRGQVDVPHWATTTMELLRLDKKYRATILQTQINTLGMLDKVKHYVSWQEADLEITKELLDKSAHRFLVSVQLNQSRRMKLFSQVLSVVSMEQRGVVHDVYVVSQMNRIYLSAVNFLWFVW